MSSSFLDYFDANIKILKLGGMWMPEQNSSLTKKLCYLAYNSFWMLYSVCLFAPAELMVLGNTAKNFNDLMKNLNMSLTHLLAMIKVIIWFRMRSEIINIIETLRNASSAYEAIDNFDPDEITRRDKREKNIATIAFIVLACSVSISACMTSLIVLAVSSKEDFLVFNNRTNITTYVYSNKLPYFSYVPWDYKSSNWKYVLAVIFQFFPVFNFAFIIVGFDTLFTTIISYTSAQLLILQGAFRTIRQRCLRRLNMVGSSDLLDPFELAEETSKEMNRCVKHLQTIFNVCQKLESIFTYITLVQVLISLLVFCTCLYLVSSFPITSGKFAVEMVYLVAIEMQLSFYCYFGNKVTLRGEDISLALYEGDWLSSNKSFKQSMIITMIRMRKPIHLTMGKFSPLTLATFVTISRASYSFFAVLKNSQGKLQ